MLGMFVAGGTLLFTLAIFYVGKNQNLFSSNLTLKSIFRDINGLTVGNNVRFAGIKIGSVSEIDILDDTSVVVKIFIEKSYQKFLRKDSKMAIGSDGLMGDKLINITTGSISKKTIEDGDFLPIVRPINMDLILNSAQATLFNVEIVSKEISEFAYKINHAEGLLNTFLNDKESTVRVKNILRNTESATFNLAEDLKAVQSNFLLRGYFKKKAKEKAKEKERKEEGK